MLLVGLNIALKRALF